LLLGVESEKLREGERGGEERERVELRFGKRE